MSSAFQGSTASRILCFACLLIAKRPSLCCFAFDAPPVARRAWGEADTQCNSGLLHGLRACGAACQASGRLDAVLAGVCEYSLPTNELFPTLGLVKVSAPLPVSDEGIQGMISAGRLFLQPFCSAEVLLTALHLQMPKQKQHACR